MVVQNQCLGQVFGVALRNGQWLTTKADPKHDMSSGTRPEAEARMKRQVSANRFLRRECVLKHISRNPCTDCASRRLNMLCYPDRDLHVYEGQHFP